MLINFTDSKKKKINKNNKKNSKVQFGNTGPVGE
jgi:hypothetical protein